MRKINHIIFLIFFQLLFTFSAFSQKTVLTDEDGVTEMVTKEIDAVFQSKRFLKQKNKKFATVSGKIVVDIGVIQSGKVSTLFKVESDFNNPLFTNFLSDHKFNFKLEKQEYYKVRYMIIF